MPGGYKEVNTTLVDLEPGEKGKIIRIGAAARTNKRLVKAGLTRGATLTVVRVGPPGGPMEIEVRGHHLTLRKSEAVAVKVERAT
jgi:Fe2+ transport system protein FeoA